MLPDKRSATPWTSMMPSAFRLDRMSSLPTMTAAVNVGAGTTASVNDVINLLALHLPPARCAPHPTLDCGVTRSCLDHTAAADLLGWKPTAGAARVVAEPTSTAPHPASANAELERITA